MDRWNYSSINRVYYKPNSYLKAHQLKETSSKPSHITINPKHQRFPVYKRQLDQLTDRDQIGTHLWKRLRSNFNIEWFDFIAVNVHVLIHWGFRSRFFKIDFHWNLWFPLENTRSLQTWFVTYFVLHYTPADLDVIWFRIFL